MSRWDLEGRERSLIDRGETLGAMSTLRSQLYDLEKDAKKSSMPNILLLSRAVGKLIDIITERIEDELQPDPPQPEAVQEKEQTR